MPLDPKNFAMSRRAAESLADYTYRRGTLDHEKAVAYLTGKAEPNVFTPRESKPTKAKLVKYRRTLT